MRDIKRSPAPALRRRLAGFAQKELRAGSVIDHCQAAHAVGFRYCAWRAAMRRNRVHTLDRHTMNLSGIVVVATPQALEAVAAQVTALPGIVLARLDRRGARIALVQAADGMAQEAAGLRAIQRTHGVVKVDLVSHVFDDRPERAPDVDAILPTLATERGVHVHTMGDPAHDRS
jgi:nitrate reductase NapAB chaperone NapD